MKCLRKLYLHRNKDKAVTVEVDLGTYTQVCQVCENVKVNMFYVISTCIATK